MCLKKTTSFVEEILNTISLSGLHPLPQNFAGPGTILSALVQACCHHRRRKTSVTDDEIDSEKYYEQQIMTGVVSTLWLTILCIDAVYFGSPGPQSIAIHIAILCIDTDSIVPRPETDRLKMCQESTRMQPMRRIYFARVIFLVLIRSTHNGQAYKYWPKPQLKPLQAYT